MITLVSIVVGIIVGVLYDYLFLPARTLQDGSFWTMIVIVLVVIAIINMIDYENPIGFIAGGAAAVIAVIGIAISFFNTPLFNADKYANLIEVKEVPFEEALEEINSVNNIALMDTKSAAILGNRTLGELADLMSVFDVYESDYSTINYKGGTYKVAPLSYEGFFKWNKNKYNGIPGYVIVDPLKRTGEYIELPEGMMVSPSDYFGRNLKRQVRKVVPNMVQGKAFFEIDEEGTPFFITPCYKSQIGLFGGRMVDTVVITNGLNRKHEIYKVGEIPDWVDIVYNGDELCKLYDYYGLYQDGWWNAKFTQTGCKETTADYGYKAIGDDSYIYTGITSANATKVVSSFMLANGRTGEFIEIPVTGGDEFSAMDAAEGEIQQTGYQALFPSLINVNGVPTYIMMMIDDSHMVKRYAMVNVNDYNQIAIDKTQEGVFAKYQRALNGEVVDNLSDTVPATETTTTTTTETVEIPDQLNEKEIIVNNIEFIVNNGKTTVYIEDTEGKYYKTAFNEFWITKKVGDTIKIGYSDEAEITNVYTYEKVVTEVVSE